jgi:hypothetical protein
MAAVTFFASFQAEPPAALKIVIPGMMPLSHIALPLPYQTLRPPDNHFHDKTALSGMTVQPIGMIFVR